MVVCAHELSDISGTTSTMSAPPDPLVCFGAFQLDCRTGELRKAGVRSTSPISLFRFSTRCWIIPAISLRARN